MPIRTVTRKNSTEDGRLGAERRITFMGDEAAWVEALRARKPAAIAAFHDRYAERILRILVRILGHDRDLQDVQHEAFVRALGSIDQLRDPSCLTQWITSVAVLTARTCIQRRQRRRWLIFFAPGELPTGIGPSVDWSPETLEALRATYRLFERMPTDERILFALRYVEGMELSEIAGACGSSLATVKRRLARAERRFAALARLDPALCDRVERGGRWTAS
jgi:RNA polymerase sigma-70 factor, ECF subfamily